MVLFSRLSGRGICGGRDLKSLPRLFLLQVLSPGSDKSQSTVLSQQSTHSSLSQVAAAAGGAGPPGFTSPVAGKVGPPGGGGAVPGPALTPPHPAGAHTPTSHTAAIGGQYKKKKKILHVLTQSKHSRFVVTCKRSRFYDLANFHYIWTAKQARALDFRMPKQHPCGSWSLRFANSGGHWIPLRKELHLASVPVQAQSCAFPSKILTHTSTWGEITNAFIALLSLCTTEGSITDWNYFSRRNRDCRDGGHPAGRRREQTAAPQQQHQPRLPAQQGQSGQGEGATAGRVKRPMLQQQAG